MSQGSDFVRMMWERVRESDVSFECCNHAMQRALNMAVGSHMAFEAADFQRADGSMVRIGHGRWLGDKWDENLYCLAVQSGNTSVIQALEEVRGIGPFIANDVSYERVWSDCFVHTGHMNWARGRLAIDACVRLDGKRWYVTGMDAKRVLFSAYATGYRKGTPNKRMTVLKENMLTVFPKTREGGSFSDMPAFCSLGGSTLLSPQSAGRIRAERARAEKWKQLAKDAALVLSAHAVGVNTVLAIESAVDAEGGA